MLDLRNQIIVSTNLETDYDLLRSWHQFQLDPAHRELALKLSKTEAIPSFENWLSWVLDDRADYIVVEQGWFLTKNVEPGNVCEGSMMKVG